MNKPKKILRSKIVLFLAVLMAFMYINNSPLFSSGFDAPEDINRLPSGFTGGIWTNRIDRIRSTLSISSDGCFIASLHRQMIWKECFPEIKRTRISGKSPSRRAASAFMPGSSLCAWPSRINAFFFP